MSIEIQALTFELLDDFLYFFDNEAFVGHAYPDWAGCCCTHFHRDSEFEMEHRRLCEAGIIKYCRDYAKEFIKDGVMQGYLAYLDGKAIGWCNANDKAGYKNLAERKELWDDLHANEKIKAMVCFTVAPHMRGKGVATQLLNRVCSDAKTEGYSCVEAYPLKGMHDIYENHPGPFEMYERHGFSIFKDLGSYYIVRKYV